MIQLLVVSDNILAQGPFADDGDNIRAYTPSGEVDNIYPKHLMDGWQIVEVDAPDGFTPDGYTWDGATVIANPPTVVPPIVPKQVTMRQARLAMLAAGCLSGVQPAIDNMPSPQKEDAQIEWDYSSVVERQRPLVAILGAILGLTDAQIDALFIQAATL